ncbi:hypothetical protein OK016_16185 [Vibrio chagasii]|nr:hypothetical protein [Vibrio chagasii]
MNVFSFQSRISSITKGDIEEGCNCKIMPLMTDQNDKTVIDRIKLISCIKVVLYLLRLSICFSITVKKEDPWKKIGRR